MRQVDKITFLVVTAEQAKRAFIEEAVRRHVTSPMIYFAVDGAEALAKVMNAPPDVVITDFDLTKLSATQFIDRILSERNMASLAVVIADQPPAKEVYLDELATGRVQFLNTKDPEELSHCIVKALNYSSHGERGVYYLRFLAKGDRLLRQGDRAEFVFIVKRGRLQAYQTAQGKDIPLGDIERGEFVGEMAYINAEVRSASVVALTDCELIEIPIGTLDRLLYNRPAWSKTLMQTLSRRLKHANASKGVTRK